MRKKSIQWRSRKEQLIWHIINSLIAGALVFLGAITDGQLTQTEALALFFHDSF